MLAHISWVLVVLALSWVGVPGIVYDVSAEIAGGQGGSEHRQQFDFPVGHTVVSDVPLQNIVKLVAGGGHTCALTTAGEVKCWGWGVWGQLGNGMTIDRGTPTNVVGLTSGVIGLAAGATHTCALMAGGGVKCWGSNYLGQLGDGTTISRSTPVDVSGLTSGVIALQAGFGHTCALTTGGKVKCWGLNNHAQVGDLTNINRIIPVDLKALVPGPVVQSLGWEHTCALTTVGGAKCWGRNDEGQLGDGTVDNRFSAVDVSGLAHDVTALAAGANFTCALVSAQSGQLASGGVKCWGGNYYGNLGDGTTTTSLTPVDVSGLEGGVAALAGRDEHTCVLMTGGGVKCWGWNTDGQLGDGTRSNRSTPVNVSSLDSGVASLTVGDSHSCALTTSGGVKCWGGNDLGQLGDGTRTRRLEPVDVVVPMVTDQTFLPVIQR